MGRIKRGFSKGSVVVCIKDEWQIGRRFITVGREYIVLEYLPKNSSQNLRYIDGYPKIMIKEDTIGLKKLLSCSYFMPKDEYLRKLRNDKISQII
jgi:uncharacterized membrane protein YcaP (DUF421 family)